MSDKCYSLFLNTAFGSRLTQLLGLNSFTKPCPNSFLVVQRTHNKKLIIKTFSQNILQKIHFLSNEKNFLNNKFAIDLVQLNSVKWLQIGQLHKQISFAAECCCWRLLSTGKWVLAEFIIIKFLNTHFMLC